MLLCVGMGVTEFYCVLGEAFHALFLIPSKAGRRMRVGKQSPFGSPPLLKTQGLISNPLLSLRRVSAPWGTTRTWPGQRDQGTQTGGGTEGMNAHWLCKAGVLCTNCPFFLPACLSGRTAAGCPLHQLTREEGSSISPLNLPPCQGALAPLC